MVTKSTIKKTILDMKRNMHLFMNTMVHPNYHISMSCEQNFGQKPKFDICIKKVTFVINICTKCHVDLTINYLTQKLETANKPFSEIQSM